MFPQCERAFDVPLVWQPKRASFLYFGELHGFSMLYADWSESPSVPEQL